VHRTRTTKSCPWAGLGWLARTRTSSVLDEWRRVFTQLPATHAAGTEPDRRIMHQNSGTRTYGTAECLVICRSLAVCAVDPSYRVIEPERPQAQTVLSGRSWCLSVFPAHHRPCLSDRPAGHGRRAALALAGCMLLALHAPPCARIGLSGARAVAVTLVYSSLTGGTLSHAATQRPSGHEPHERMHSGRRGRPVLCFPCPTARPAAIGAFLPRGRERERERERARRVSGGQRQRQHVDTATRGSLAPAHTFVRAA
jgi:hypothetical protein